MEYEAEGPVQYYVSAVLFSDNTYSIALIVVLHSERELEIVIH